MIEFLIVSLIFFFLGRYSISSQDIDKAKEIVTRFKKKSIGLVKRPDRKRLRQLKDVKFRQEEQEMEDVLDGVVR